MLYSTKYSPIYINNLVPQVPSDITTLPTYVQNGQLSQLIVQWSHEVRYTQYVAWVATATTF